MQYTNYLKYLTDHQDVFLFFHLDYLKLHAEAMTSPSLHQLHFNFSLQ
jgi:hypothetical protein